MLEIISKAASKFVLLKSICSNRMAAMPSTVLSTVQLIR